MLEAVSGEIILTVLLFPDSSISIFLDQQNVFYASYGNIGHVFCVLVHLACILFYGNIVHIYIEHVSTNLHRKS